MADQVVDVRIDDRVRLMSALLAATNWAEKAQQRVGHRPHAHARRTTQWVAQLKDHPAVTNLQTLLDKNAPLEASYTYIMRLTYPELHSNENPSWVPANWHDQIRDFHDKARLSELWEQDDKYWQKSKTEAEAIIRNANFYDFMRPFVGEFAEQLVYMPNISYPSDMAIGVRVGAELICIGPPRIAWGDNPPWPFDEDQGHVFSSALSEYARLLMLAYLRENASEIEPITKKSLPVDDEYKKKHATWGDQFTGIVVPGIVALFLERHANEQEAKAFILMEKKAKGVTILPGVVSVLRRYLSEVEEGKYHKFTDYMPLFPTHLRVAKGITAI